MTNKFKVGDKIECVRELFGIQIGDIFKVFMDNIGDLVIENKFNPKIGVREFIFVQDWHEHFEVINEQV